MAIRFPRLCGTAHVVLLIAGLMGAVPAPSEGSGEEPQKKSQVAPGPTDAAWTAETKRIKVATPQGDVEKEITYYTNSIGMKLARIPAGEFMMGTNSGQPSEKPVHRVQISKAFYMGAHEVTVGQWRAFSADAGYQTQVERGEVGASAWPGKRFQTGRGRRAKRKPLTWRTPVLAQDDSHPVICVSWKDANAFCEWLSRKEEATYRLPTEAEWEYACRAGSRTKNYWGDNVRSDCAWYRENSDDNTHPVGGKLPNAFGLYDMIGNVNEWCYDRYNEKYYSSSPSVDPEGPVSGRWRIQRSGSWAGQGRGIRSAFRFGGGPSVYLGFRVVMGSPLAAAKPPVIPTDRFADYIAMYPGVEFSAIKTDDFPPNNSDPLSKLGSDELTGIEGKTPDDVETIREFYKKDLQKSWRDYRGGMSYGTPRGRPRTSHHQASSVRTVPDGKRIGVIVRVEQEEGADSKISIVMAFLPSPE